MIKVKYLVYYYKNDIILLNIKSGNGLYNKVLFSVFVNNIS